jgi:hypothetical protein
MSALRTTAFTETNTTICTATFGTKIDTHGKYDQKENTRKYCNSDVMEREGTSTA